MTANLERRVSHLEQRVTPIGLARPLLVITAPPICPDAKSPRRCEHITAAIVDGCLFERMPDETVEALTDRAVAGSTPTRFEYADQVIVEYETAHGH